MLLAESEWASLPVAHLLALAHLLLEQVLGHFGKTRLVARDAHFAVVGLCVYKVSKQLVELHRWEMPCKDIQVALE